MLLTSSLLALMLQVGPNPSGPDTLGIPDELLNRPERPEKEGAPLSPEIEWLAQCLAFLPEEAARAHTLAQLKRNESEGDQRVLANHCLGLAATELGLWGDAITAFSAARDESPDGELRVRALQRLRAKFRRSLPPCVPIHHAESGQRLRRCKAERVECLLFCRPRRTRWAGRT